MYRLAKHKLDNDIQRAAGGYPGRGDAFDPYAQGDRQRQPDLHCQPAEIKLEISEAVVLVHQHLDLQACAETDGRAEVYVGV